MSTPASSLMPSFCWRDVSDYPTRRSRKPILSRSYLYVGLLVPELAQLIRSKSGKTYSIYSELPGIKFKRSYGPLDEMRREVELTVGEWLILAQSSIGPVLTDGGGI